MKESADSILGELDAIDERVDQLLSKVRLVEIRLGGPTPANECVPEQSRTSVEDYVRSIRADVCEADDVLGRILVKLGEPARCQEVKCSR